MYIHTYTHAYIHTYAGRFSQDLDHVDLMLPNSISSLLQNSLVMLASLCLAFYALSWFVLIFLPLAYAFYVIAVYFRASSRELKRLEGGLNE